MNDELFVWILALIILSFWISSFFKAIPIEGGLKVWGKQFLICGVVCIGLGVLIIGTADHGYEGYGTAFAWLWTLLLDGLIIFIWGIVTFFKVKNADQLNTVKLGSSTDDILDD